MKSFGIHNYTVEHRDLFMTIASEKAKQRKSVFYHEK